jgi:hypothetical protein
MIIKRIVCLANSRKMSERCVAGIELSGPNQGRWVRPVSKREHNVLSMKDRILMNGQEPRLLDIIDIPIEKPMPQTYQSENWQLDPRKKWTYVKAFAWDQLGGLADKSGSIWLNGYHTRHGQNDYVPLDHAGKLENSLMLIHVEELHISVYHEMYRPNARARFSLAGNEYILKVTDPIIEAEYFSRGDGDYALPESYLTISLGEPFQDNCYKLVAAEISKP